MESACARKLRYNTEKEAKRAMKRLRKILPYKIYYYPCEVCYGWHHSKLAPAEHGRLQVYFHAINKGRRL